jgi:site-specific DNA-methyltransferase (adenine-specific)
MTAAYSIAHGDVAAVLAGFRDNSFDAVMCDPPYGFRFMNKSWDYDVPSVETWRECLRVLKPGAPLVAFGGSRTYHRLACGIEDAGAELRDCLMWLYGKGRPMVQPPLDKLIDKAAGAVRPVIGTRTLTGNAALSTKDKAGTYGVQVGTAPAKTADVTAPATDLAKAWEDYNTVIKPAFEAIVVARKPLEGTIVDNVAKYGVGGLNIGGCRTPEGRWPANVLLDEAAAEQLDAEVGNRPSAPFRENTADGAVLSLTKRSAGGYSDSGGPSRFYFTSKVSTKEREAGCESLPLRSAAECTGRDEGSEGLSNPGAGVGRTKGARNHHTTLKPLSLTTWLARLLLPPRPGVILVPFAGAGSEMIGALRAGWGGVFGIEREGEYIEIARARLRHWCPESEAA